MTLDLSSRGVTLRLAATAVLRRFLLSAEDCAADPSNESSAANDQLKNVQQVEATGTAFAAILGDGSVVTWGDVCVSSDCNAVQHQPKDV